MRDYHINVFDSEEEGAYVADIEVENARDLWLGVAREDGKPIRELRAKPAIYRAAYT
jgi:hypothetical protein